MVWVPQAGQVGGKGGGWSPGTRPRAATATSLSGHGGGHGPASAPPHSGLQPLEALWGPSGILAHRQGGERVWGAACVQPGADPLPRPPQEAANAPFPRLSCS